MMNLSGKRILVTGGAGTVGCELIPLLLNRGAQITILDNFSIGDRNTTNRWGDTVEVIEGDVTSEGDCEWAITGSDAVIHLARIHKPKNAWSPHDVHEVNVGGTLCVLEAMLDAKVPCLILPAPATPAEDSFLAATLAAAIDYADAYRPRGIQVQQIPFNGIQPNSVARSIVDSLEKMTPQPLVLK